MCSASCEMVYGVGLDLVGGSGKGNVAAVTFIASPRQPHSP